MLHLSSVAPYRLIRRYQSKYDNVQVIQAVLAAKYLKNVTLPNVFGDVFSDDRFIFFERARVAICHLCGDFEANVNELTKVLIIVRMALHVA